jgi:hypothetical protein
MHVLVHIYASYAMLNNIFAHLNRISYNTARGYQLVINVTRYDIQTLNSNDPYHHDISSASLVCAHSR